MLSTSFTGCPSTVSSALTRAQFFDAGADGRVERGGDRRDHDPVVVDQVDHAQLGQLADRRPGDPAQRLLGIERGVELGGRSDQQLQTPALLAHPFEREVHDAGSEQGEHHPDDRDRAEVRLDVGVGERREERRQADGEAMRKRRRGWKAAACPTAKK